jgi:hypothetical protein
MKTAVWFSVMLVLSTGRAVQAEQAKLLNKQELKALIETSNTPEEHQRIVEHYDAQAAQEERSLAADHRRQATLDCPKWFWRPYSSQADAPKSESIADN